MKMISNIKNGGESATLDRFVRKDLLGVLTLEPERRYGANYDISGISIFPIGLKLCDL